MARLRIATTCCALALAAPAATSTAQAGEKPPMVQKINAVRAAHGLPALRNSPYLRGTAKRWSSHLMSTGTFGHMGVSPSRRFPTVGEVLAYHGSWRPRRGVTVRRWLRSPSHRAAVLSPSFRYIGTSYARGRIGGRRTTIWVVQFGRR